MLHLDTAKYTHQLLKMQHIHNIQHVKNTNTVSHTTYYATRAVEPE